ncbi:hypothetical protein [Phaeobacter sp. NW0010-22]|uniref:hypothetical protein n=1 Tax=Phaeobacter sp. NW0010-22 TaxID=3135907 RepID=UPI003106B58E
MKDLHSNIGVVLALAPVVLTASAASAAVDLQGFASSEFIITTGVVAGAGDFTATVQHSDTTTGGDFEDVEAEDLLGELPATLLADGVYKIGYTGSKRYLRINLTKNGGTSISTSVAMVKGHPESAPVD